MTKAKISEYDAVAANNTDVNGVNIDEGCAPSGMNNMGREIMAALKRLKETSPYLAQQSHITVVTYPVMRRLLPLRMHHSGRELSFQTSMR
jgi:hypothetical protein